MVATRGQSELPAYELSRAASVAENQKRLQALIELRKYAATGEHMEQGGSSSQPLKKKKLTHCTSKDGNGGHNLRSKSKLNQDFEDPNYQPLEDGLEDVEEIVPDLSEQQKEKKGRGPTELKSIYNRDEPKPIVNLNEHGQPVGSNATRFANFIGILVRKQLSVAHEDWRYVDAKLKLKLWADLQSYFEVDESASNYVMATAAKKWREFKSDLKKAKYDETLTDEELMGIRDSRIDETDWKWLIDHWRKPETEACKGRGKDNRSKLSLLHVAGSKSYARIGDEMAKTLGYKPRRDEIFIKAHTRKSRVPTPQATPFIKQLEEAAANHPDLKERTIQEGDLYAHVFGEKEPRGRVRVLGLGPTPENVGTPGTNAKMPTKLAMEIELRRQAEQRVSTLLERMDQLQQQMSEMQQVVFASQRGQNVETPSPHGSRTQPMISRVRAENDDEEYHGAVEHVSMHDGLDNQDDDMIIHKRVAARNLVGTPRNLEASHSQEESLVGRDVILYHVVRPEPVARGTILSTNPETLVGGETRGRQYYEVVVNVVFKNGCSTASCI